MGYSKEARQFLKSHGPDVITHLEVVRTPLSSKITTLLNLITLNKFDEARKKAQYDKLFHLALIVKTQKQERFQIEKNERIRMGKVYGITDETERIQIVLPKTIPIWQLLARAEKRMGETDYFVYSAFHHNCQDFVYNVLKASNLLTSSISKFIKQDSMEILKHLPFYTERLANIITDLASIFTPEKHEEEVPETLPQHQNVVAIKIWKDKMTELEAKYWLVEHHYKINRPENSLSFWVFRQIPTDIEKMDKLHRIELPDKLGFLYVYNHK